MSCCGLFFMKLLYLITFIPALLFADDALVPMQIGNFALSATMQPGAFISLGDNIGQGDTLLYVFADDNVGKNSYSIDVFPSLIYGIRNDLSISFNTPFTPQKKEWKNHSSGLEDWYVEVEYAFFTKNRPKAQDQATILFDVILPTGSSTKNPPTGFGSPSFFLGATYYHTEVKWIYFTSYGALFTTTKHRTRFGNQLFYEFGIGRNIPSPAGWIFAWLVEFNGQYSWKNRMNGLTDPDSGGNVITLTPSMWFSSERIILQFGVGLPVVQHLFGHQPKMYISYDLAFGLLF